MPNKTIYVSDDDLPLLDRAQVLSGSNLSSTIAVALRQFVTDSEAQHRGYREITVRIGGAGGTRRQRFRGRRLARWRHLSAQSRRAEMFSVYQTEKGRFAVHIQRGPDWLGWSDPEDDGPSMHMVAAWRERMAARLRMSGQAPPVRPPHPPGALVPPVPGTGGSGWDGWREAWPTSGGNAADFGPVELTLEVHDSLAAMRERYPTELCDLIDRALDTPQVEDLDI